MIILVDAMGGDKAPSEIVNGCIDAVSELQGYDLVLIGDNEKISRILNKRRFNSPRIQVTHTTEVIGNEEKPTSAIKNKKDSSMVVGLRMLKESKGDVFVSAGSTGALSAGSLLIIGRIKGVDRPALAPILPGKYGPTMLVDAGLNTNCKALNYEQFAKLGAIYMREIFDIENPRVGLVNIGTEKNKGSQLVRQAYCLLEDLNINFIGNIEGRQLTNSKADVAVCDGFLGNVLLKFLEGVGSFIYEGLSSVYKKNIFSKLSALLVKKALKKFFKRLDYEEYGGTPILGVNGKVIKCHGSSNAKSVKNAVMKAYYYAKSSVVEQIKQEFMGREVGNIG